MAAPPSYDDVVAPPKPVDRASVLSGVEARLSSNPVPSSSRSDTEDQSVRLAFLRIIDTQILDRNPRKVALESLETLVKVLENARKEGPQEERQKYRTLKLTNPLVKRTVVDVHGAKDYLLACRFAPRVIAFVEHLCFPLSPTAYQSQHLALGLSVLQQRMVSVRESAATEERMKAREEEAEGGRRDKALEMAREDRERKKMRDEWAREGRAAGTAAAAPAVPSSGPICELSPVVHRGSRA